VTAVSPPAAVFDDLRLLVTDGETRAALAAVRALGARGATLHVASEDGGSLAGASRHAAADHALGSTDSDPWGWATRLETVVAREGLGLVVPVGDTSLAILYAAGTGERVCLAAPTRETYEAATDKRALLERAARLGVDVPRGVFVPDPRQLHALPEGFSYPVVLKARRSRFLEEGRWIEGPVRIAHDMDELRRLCHDPGLRGGLLLQEYLAGHGEGLFLLAQGGRPLARFAHRRLREKPPTGGVSVLRESIAPEPQLLEWSERLLADLAFTGVAMVEFRRTPEGRAALMEINPRLWGSLQLAVDAGVDFASLLVALHRGAQLEERAVAVARLGVRTRWLLGDVDQLWISLRYPDRRRLAGRSLARIVWDFVTGFFDGSRLEVLRRDDPRPFLRELRTWLRSRSPSSISAR
jgi:predicted ATP-grasp superfamily ATP-dependent carboligase